MTRLENGNWELVLDEFNNDIKRRMVEEKFIMIPRQSSERIPELLCACDAAFLSFQNDPLWKKTIPAKLQSYTACGMPMLLTRLEALMKVLFDIKIMDFLSEYLENTN